MRLLAAPQAGPEDLLSADGYLFVTPENLATMAGLMKDFFDRCYYPVLGPHRRPALCGDGLRRQRRQRRGAADRAHLHRLAAEGAWRRR